MGTTKTDPAQLVRQARDLIEESNRVVLDAEGLSAPALSETVQALKSLVERLPQAFEQTAYVLTRLAADDKVTVEQGDRRPRPPRRPRSCGPSRSTVSSRRRSCPTPLPRCYSWAAGRSRARLRACSGWWCTGAGPRRLRVTPEEACALPSPTRMSSSRIGVGQALRSPGLPKIPSPPERRLSTLCTCRKSDALTGHWG